MFRKRSSHLWQDTQHVHLSIKDQCVDMTEINFFVHNCYSSWPKIFAPSTDYNIIFEKIKSLLIIIWNMSLEYSEKILDMHVFEDTFPFMNEIDLDSWPSKVADVSWKTCLRFVLYLEKDEWQQRCKSKISTLSERIHKDFLLVTVSSSTWKSIEFGWYILSRIFSFLTPVKTTIYWRKRKIDFETSTNLIISMSISDNTDCIDKEDDEI